MFVLSNWKWVIFSNMAPFFMGIYHAYRRPGKIKPWNTSYGRTNYFCGKLPSHL